MAETTFAYNEAVSGGYPKVKNLQAVIDTYYKYMPLKFFVTGTAANTGTGNSVISAIKADKTVKTGAWKFTFSAATAGTLTDPDGNIVAIDFTIITTKTYTFGGLTFTWTVGATPQIGGDYITITIGTTGYYEYSVDEPEAICWEAKTLSSAGYLSIAVEGEILASAIVNDSNAALTLNTVQKAHLQANGIIIR